MGDNSKHSFCKISSNNNSKSQEKDFSLDWYEDAESEAEWADGLSVHGTESAPASIIVENDYNQEIFTDDLREKNKILERAWKEAEKKYQNMQTENERLKIQLENEKHKALKYQTKLKYIQDNQEIFNRLKQAYLNMKYNEAVGREMVEIKEKACQTWDGVLCKTCIETAELNRQKQFEELCQFASNITPKETSSLLAVKRTDLTRIEETMKTLRSMINKREKSWSYNREKENRLKNTISNLEIENSHLRDLLKAKDIEPKILKTSESSQADLACKDAGVLKKIIVKLEKRNRGIEKLNKWSKYPSLLNEKENETVQQIMAKYYKRLQQKQHRYTTRSMSCDRITSSTRFLPTPRSARVETRPSSARVAQARGDWELKKATVNLLFPSNAEAEEVFKTQRKEMDLIDFSDDTPICIIPIE